MGCASCICRSLVKLVLLSTGCILVLSLLPLVDIDAPTTQLDDAVVFEGVLQENRLLSDGELLFSNKIQGPESIAEYAGDLYSGVVGGHIVKLGRDGRDPILIANVTGAECRFDGLWDQKDCGRPLGLRFDTKGKLYVIDAYLGIKKIDVKSGAVETVFDPRGVSVDGQAILFLDDIVIDEGAGEKGGHVFYLTDVSGKFELATCFMTFLSMDRSGRLLKYDTDSGKVSVVAKDIIFPNGIEITDDKQAVIVSEIAARRLLKVLIKGKDSGKTLVLNQNLPCMVDNIRRSGRKQETYWCACFGAHKQRDLMDKLREYPFVTKAILTFSYNTGSLLMKIGQALGMKQFLELGYHLRGGDLIIMADTVKKAGLILEVDKNGKVIKSLQDPEGKLSFFSEVHEVQEGGKRHLYLASFVNPYVVKVTIENEEKEAASPAPKATPSSPKPTAKPASAPTTSSTTTTTATKTSTTTAAPKTTKSTVAGKNAAAKSGETVKPSAKASPKPESKASAAAKGSEQKKQEL